MGFFSEGHGRGTKYYLPQAPIQSITGGITNVATSGSNMATSGSNMATSGGNMATSGGNMATSGDNMATPESNMATSGDNMATSEKQTSKRLSRDAMTRLIIDSCSDWISLDELSQRVERSQKYLRTFILPLLLASKKIEMLYPGTPNHPRQKYKKTY